MQSDHIVAIGLVLVALVLFGGIVGGGMMQDHYRHEQALACIQSGGSPITNRDVVFCVR